MSRFERTLQSRSAERGRESARVRALGGKAAGRGLASARDRQSVRERKVAERERVERMLASVPAIDERRARDRATAPSGVAQTAASRRFLRAVQPPSCPICRGTELVSDEVMQGGTLRLAECLHCAHRWTERPRRRWAELGATMNRHGRGRAAQAFSTPA
ncbi:MAG: hypothetical protein CL908_20740 [Deltaproteobacteria bacterium]|jgi:hypothetical protein|nr:hypothetical protein [Deltaproteobacteria bacterium]